MNNSVCAGLHWKELRGGDRSDLLQLFDHGSIANVPGVKNGIDAFNTVELLDQTGRGCRLATAKRSQLVGIVIVTQLPRRTARTPHGTQT